MNQILITRIDNKVNNESYENYEIEKIDIYNKLVKRNIFLFQLVISIVIIIFLFVKNSFENYNNSKMEKLSYNINKSLKISSLYNVKKETKEDELYFGKIIIPKINLEYPVFNTFNEELLKISPCKFYGVQIGEKGNICIAGHNYNDDRFFGKLFELEKNDIIKLVNLNNETYLYRIFDIYETFSDDLSCLESKKEYELTLVTCNNSNKKRKIIKAVYNEFINVNNIVE